MDQRKQDQATMNGWMEECHEPRIVARSARVLAINDDPVVHDRLRLVLEPQHTMTCESSVMDAILRIVHGERFDLILCSLDLPDMNGLDFLTHMAAASPEHAERTVLMVSGTSAEESFQAARSIGVPLLDTARDVRYMRILAGWYAR
jgi:CheY-like chemotaxis protein